LLALYFLKVYGKGHGTQSSQRVSRSLTESPGEAVNEAVNEAVKLGPGYRNADRPTMAGRPISLSASHACLGL